MTKLDIHDLTNGFSSNEIQLNLGWQDIFAQSSFSNATSILLLYMLVTKVDHGESMTSNGWQALDKFQRATAIVISRLFQVVSMIVGILVNRQYGRLRRRQSIHGRAVSLTAKRDAERKTTDFLPTFSLLYHSPHNICTADQPILPTTCHLALPVWPASWPPGHILSFLSNSH